MDDILASLPLGAIVAVCELEGCYATTQDVRLLKRLGKLLREILQGADAFLLKRRKQRLWSEILEIGARDDPAYLLDLC